MTDDALDAIAQEVIARETGARGLRSILENLMLDTMFELPSQEGVQKCIVTKDSVIEGVELELVFSEDSSADSLTEAKSA